MENKQEIHLEISSTMKDTHGEEQTTKQSLTGQLIEKGSTIYLRYEEELEETGKVQNTIKIEEHKVTVLRTGSVRMNHTYYMGMTSQGMYHSPFGPMAMETNTLAIQFHRENNRGSFSLQYDLILNEQEVGQFTLEVTFS